MMKWSGATDVALVGMAGGGFAQQARVNLDYNSQKDTEHLVQYLAESISPDVHDDGTVTFRLKARDLWKHETVPTAGDSSTALVPPYGVVMLRVSVALRGGF